MRADSLFSEPPGKPPNLLGFYGSFISPAWSIIISSSRPFPLQRMGDGAENSKLLLMIGSFLWSTPTQKAPKSHPFRIKDAPETQEIIRALGALCQELDQVCVYAITSVIFFNQWLFLNSHQGNKKKKNPLNSLDHSPMLQAIFATFSTIKYQSNNTV